MASVFRGIHPLLKLDAAETVKRITAKMADLVRYDLGRRGAVVAVSGGIDSSVTAALCALALGPQNVMALMMPERESSETTRRLSLMLVKHLGIHSVLEEITAALEGAGCYRRRDEALRSLIPGYGRGWKCKLVNAPLLEGGDGSLFSIVAKGPEQEEVKREPPIEVLRKVVAASNFKQRTRKMMEYYYADLLNYAVAGTSNRMEAELGFFVKLGDGASDVKPIAHLYKSQVYELAAHLDLPAELLEVAPTPDTYPLAADAEEFFFGTPLQTLDLCMFCRNERYSLEKTAEITGLRTEQVRTIFADITAKRAPAAYLSAAPLLVEQP